MGQVTVYLDDETEARLKSLTKSKGIPVSRWIAELAREKTATEWLDEVRRLAGAWADFPDAETLRGGRGDDVRREPF